MDKHGIALLSSTQVFMSTLNSIPLKSLMKVEPKNHSYLGWRILNKILKSLFRLSLSNMLRFGNLFLISNLLNSLYNPFRILLYSRLRRCSHMDKRGHGHPPVYSFIPKEIKIFWEYN
jgi:hypothetical protein